MSYESHLYLILHPNSALVASQLDPEQFARHYLSGSTRHYPGRLVFAEVDLAFRNDFFRIEWGLDELRPHPDGTPKRTKFIASYRVLEHVDLSAISRLFLASPEGYVLPLDPGGLESGNSGKGLRVVAELDPLRMLVLTSIDMADFGAHITGPQNPKGAPRVLYTELDIDIDDFLETFERNPFMPPPVPNLHPSKLRDAILECRQLPAKRTKGLSISSDLDGMGFGRLRRGFVFASAGQSRFFPLPSRADMERRNLKFSRAM